MGQDLGQSHHRHLFGSDHRIEAGGNHALAAHAEELGALALVLTIARKLPLKRIDQQRAVVLAAGLARRDEDPGWHPFACCACCSSALIIDGSVARASQSAIARVSRPAPHDFLPPPRTILPLE